MQCINHTHTPIDCNIQTDTHTHTGDLLHFVCMVYQFLFSSSSVFCLLVWKQWISGRTIAVQVHSLSLALITAVAVLRKQSCSGTVCSYVYPHSVWCLRQCLKKKKTQSSDFSLRSSVSAATGSENTYIRTNHTWCCFIIKDTL